MENSKDHYWNSLVPYVVNAVPNRMLIRRTAELSHAVKH